MSIFYNEEIGFKIARQLGYEVDSIISDADFNINGHVYALNDGLVMKISFYPDFRLLERLRDGGYPIHSIHCYREPETEDNPVTDFSLCIRSDIADLEVCDIEFFNKVLNLIPRIYTKHDIDEYKEIIEGVKREFKSIEEYEALNDEDQNALYQILDAMVNFFKITDYIYHDISIENFGYYDGKVVIRDFEGGQAKDVIPPHTYEPIILDMTANKNCKSEKYHFDF